LEEKKWAEVKDKGAYDLELAKWLLLSMIEKNSLKTATLTLEDKSEASVINKMVLDALVDVRGLLLNGVSS